MDFKDIDMGEFGRHLFQKILKQTATDGGFQEIMDECVQKKIQYTDETFPPNDHSLINNWDEEEVQDKVKSWKKFTWQRAKEIDTLNDEGKLSVFYQDISPSDIKQGALGDCYFLSVLSVLAEVPDRIKRLILTTRQNDQGIYAVKICKNGEWREVVTDDFYPCMGEEPAFTQSVGDELWPLILEKSWAKLHGSYERIEAGFAENVMRDLTGAPCEVVNNDDEQLFEKLSEAEQSGWMMAASAGSTEASKEQLDSLGLIPNHAYGCLNARAAKDKNGNTVKLIQLRNPWGETEWKGDWSDDSELWTPTLKKQLGWTDADDGTFWMCLEDLITYFSRFQICRVNDKYLYGSFNGNHKIGSYSLIRMIVNKSGHHYVSVAQIDERCFSRDEKYDYSNVRLIVAKIDDDNDKNNLKLTYLNGKMGWDRDTWEVYEHLEEGQYYCFVEFDWPEKSEIHDFCISCYGESKAVFIRDEKSMYEKQDILRQLMGSAAESNIEGCKVVSMEKNGCPDIKKYTMMLEEGYGFVHIVNEDHSSSYKESVNYLKFEGLELMKPYKGSSYELEVKPGERKTVVIRQTEPTGYSMSSQMQGGVVLGADQLKIMCKEQGKKTQRAHPQTKQPLDIYQYCYKHGSGIAYLYENQTSNKTLDETLKFSLVGLEIVGEPGATQVKIKIGPGQSKFIELKSIAAKWKIGTAIAYGIH